MCELYSLRAKAFQPLDTGSDVVKSMEITRVTVRDRLVVDVEVRMEDPKDYDFLSLIHI